MLESVRKAVLAGLPTIAECGGYLCLHEELTDADGNRYPMAGVIPAKCHFAGFQRQFGYVTMTTLRDGVFGKEGTSCRGHEFHYYVSDSHRQDVLCGKPDGRRCWRGGMVNDSLYAGFTHLWLPSGPEAVRGFVNACRKGRNLWND
jgi:cobyrinic acid a,c-diamide synthase